MHSVAARLAISSALVLGAMWAPVADATKAGGAQNHVTVWTPEYFGGKVYVNTFDYTVNPSVFTQKIINVQPKSCNPNSVVVGGANLYVVCNSDFGGKDQILVYNASTRAFVRTITGVGTDGNNYFFDSSLIGSVIDKHGNLWVSGYNGNDLLRISAGRLTSSTPKVDRQVIHSPDMPAGMAIDSSNGAFWIVGQFAGGIVLEFPDAVLNQTGTFLGATAMNPSPSFCISDFAGEGCQNVAGLFDNPEGVALFDGSIWVSNNGGNAPTGTIVRLRNAGGGQLTSSTFGGTVGKPFSCPGGMFSASVAGGTPTLWVNDEGYGVANTDCGSSPADQGDQIGRVLEFLPNDLLKHQTKPVPEVFTSSGSLKTASPGFGGMFVQMD